MTYALEASFRSIPRSPDLHIRGPALGPNESKIDQRESAPLPRARAAVEARTAFRDRIAEMVRDHETRVGSRMLAYRTVGRLLAVSDTWVRRLIGGQPVRIDLETVSAADTAYAAHCARLEARAAARLEAAARRSGESDALLASLRGRGPVVDRGRPVEDPIGPRVVRGAETRPGCRP